MLKFFKRLFIEEQEQQKEPIQEPFQVMEKLRDLMDHHYVFRFKDDVYSDRIYFNPDENKVEFEILDSNPVYHSILENNSIPSLLLYATGTGRFGTRQTKKFSMKLNHYEIFFDSNGIRKFKRFLDDKFIPAAHLISQHPNDGVYEVLLIRNADSFQTVLKMFSKSVSSTAEISIETATLFEEILSNFCEEVTARSEALKNLNEQKINELDASMRDELLREVEYQREIRNLDHQSSYPIETKKNDKIG